MPAFVQAIPLTKKKIISTWSQLQGQLKHINFLINISKFYFAIKQVQSVMTLVSINEWMDDSLPWYKTHNTTKACQTSHTIKSSDKLPKMKNRLQLRESEMCKTTSQLLIEVSETKNPSVNPSKAKLAALITVNRR